MAVVHVGRFNKSNMYGSTNGQDNKNQGVVERWSSGHQQVMITMT